MWTATAARIATIVGDGLDVLHFLLCRDGANRLDQREDNSLVIVVKLFSREFDFGGVESHAALGLVLTVSQNDSFGGGVKRLGVDEHLRVLRELPWRLAVLLDVARGLPVDDARLGNHVTARAFGHLDAADAEVGREGLLCDIPESLDNRATLVPLSTRSQGVEVVPPRVEPRRLLRRAEEELPRLQVLLIHRVKVRALRHRVRRRLGNSLDVLEPAPPRATPRTGCVEGVEQRGGQGVEFAVFDGLHRSKPSGFGQTLSHNAGSSFASGTKCSRDTDDSSTGLHVQPFADFFGPSAHTVPGRTW